MENSIKKQAKSDIFKELYPIISFYIKKGAKPSSLKKYYKNSKRFNDILEDIKNKGINLVKDETEYHQLVKETLNEILDDFVAKEKDDNYKNKDKKMKHLKEYNSFKLNEGAILSFIIGILLFKFINSILKNYIDKNHKEQTKLNISRFLSDLENVKNIPVSEFNDRYFMQFESEKGGFVDIRIFKNDKIMTIENNLGKSKYELSDDDYNRFLKMIGKL